MRSQLSQLLDLAVSDADRWDRLAFNAHNDLVERLREAAILVAQLTGDTEVVFQLGRASAVREPRQVVAIVQRVRERLQLGPPATS